MGYLLKEALKALCGVNQWSYAVFWKIGCQNPKLLIWEECYHGTLSSPGAPHNPTTGNHGINPQKLEGYQNAAQVGELIGDRVRLLMEKMMMSNHINMVGQGLVGRAAFTGNHQWIVSGSYNEKAHPTEVANEIHLQFSAGMQTIVVVPVAPHGVIQLGSPLAIMENVGFVHDARSLILQIGCVPSAFASDDYVAKDVAGMFGLPIADSTSMPINLHGNRGGMSYTPAVPGYFNMQRSSSQAQRLINHSSNSLLTQFQDNLQVSVSTFPTPNSTQDLCRSQKDHWEAKISSTLDSSVPPNGLVENRITGGLVMPLKTGSLINYPTCSNNLASSANFTQPAANCRGFTLLKQPIAQQKGLSEANHEISTVSSSISTSLFETNESHYANLKGYDTDMSGNTDFSVGVNGHSGQSSQRSALANVMFHDADPSVKELLGLLNTVDKLSSSLSIGVCNPGKFTVDNGNTVKHISGKLETGIHEVRKFPSETKEHLLSGDFAHDDLCNVGQIRSLKDHMSEDIFFKSTAGDDLFDVLGMDFKNKLLSGNEFGFGADTKDPIKDSPRSTNLQNLGSQVCSGYEGIPETGVFSSSVSDHLLDAVISGVSSASKQIPDDIMSCRTTVSKISSSSVPSTPHSNAPTSGLVNMSDRMKEQLCGISKPMVRLGEPIGTSTQSGCGKNDGGNCSTTSSAYVSQISSWVEQGHSASVSTANSRKPDEVGKSNRKRLKPGENPKPRPKDRQMIQDRVKELRDIVPNGAKCSIDALLERTIKHMLFLQSVTKHAEKLKQTVEPKIANKEGGMLLNDHFEGGATWAFELGSQSMVCPIVVEDLNPPRQLLIKMLCEERGLFLEIADIIRGLGLTIMKGVMEARNDKIWARFAVEANRDVTRMEVFISLVHLLEQTLKVSTSGNGRKDRNIALHPALMPAEQQLVG